MGEGPKKRKYPYLTTYVHRDLKPENIFLGAPHGYSDDGIPIYPTAKMGDFGLTIATGDDDELHNPHELREIGTWGYKAPEQKHCREVQEQLPVEIRADLNDFVPEAIKHDWPLLGSPTNVWGVGACIYKLILLTDLTHDLTKAFEHGRALGKLQTHRNPEYSSALLNLVHRCLKIDPQRRPTLQKLGEIIASQRSSFRNRWSMGRTVAAEAILRFTKDEIDKMDTGPFVQGENIDEDLD
ncbi:MAG: hypothetical protein Q9209_001188 [Squamulea sp. 1 TL-2023]